MRLRFFFTIGTGLCLLIGACATQEPTKPSATASDTSSPTAIQLDKTVHFSAPDGSDVLAAPGSYQVEAAQTSRLKLIPEDGENKTPLLIEALTTSFDLEIPSAVALAIRLQEDEHHVLLLLPDGKAYEAVGSSSSVRPRGTGITPLTTAQVKAALRAKRAPSP